MSKFFILRIGDRSLLKMQRSADISPPLFLCLFSKQPLVGCVFPEQRSEELKNRILARQSRSQKQESNDFFSIRSGKLRTGE